MLKMWRSLACSRLEPAICSEAFLSSPVDGVAETAQQGGVFGGFGGDNTITAAEAGVPLKRNPEMSPKNCQRSPSGRLADSTTVSLVAVRANASCLMIDGGSCCSSAGRSVTVWPMM